MNHKFDAENVRKFNLLHKKLMTKEYRWGKIAKCKQYEIQLN